MLSLTRGKRKLKGHPKEPQRIPRCRRVTEALSGKGRVRVERSHRGFVHLLNARYVACMVTDSSYHSLRGIFCHHPHSTISQTCGPEKAVWFHCLVWLQATLDLKADFPLR